MQIKSLLCLILTALTLLVKAQTLFTYGTHAVSKDEFLQAYNKNPDTTGNRSEKLRQYLDLYTNFKLKLQAAYDEKADKNASLKAEAENFKNQLTDNLINHQADINQLMHEAFLRSQKDILVQQLFAKFSGNDTADAFAQISKTYNELKAGKNFDDISAASSNDSTAKLVKENIGYITVFTLPYSIENIIYNLKPGEFSSIYKSSAGYHIFKNAGERAALGRKKIQQLIFPTPAFYTNEQVNSAAHTADSVYVLLQKGISFDSLLPLFAQNYNEMQDANTIEVKVGDYSEDFEKEVFSLKDTGDISKPFKTAYGYNIIKLVENLPVSADENDILLATWLQNQIQIDSRLSTAKTNLAEKWLSITGFKEMPYNRTELWAYTDSALSKTSNLPVKHKSVLPSTVLFVFTKKKITVKDWIEYLNSTATSSNVQHDYLKQMHDFVLFACNNYYREHVEEFNPEISEQVKEFNDANLIFYVMDKYVWSKASNDSAGLKKYYETHKTNYKWKESAAALIISAPSKALADSVSLKIKNNPVAWRSIIASNNNIYADSNRFEVDQLPVKQKVLLQKDFETTPEANEAGDAYTFVHIMQVYLKPEEKSFEEAKGMVINDYQQQLEQSWLADLREKYPVRVNTSVLNSLH